MHHVGERLRIEAHQQRERGEHGEHREFAAADVLQLRDVIVRHRAEIHALVHPQRVGGAENQRECRAERDPEIELDGGEDHHELADETRRARQAAIGHREQHRERGELRHHVDDAAVIGDLARVQAVVQHADAQEHRARHETVRDHLNDRAFDAQLVEDEEAERDEAHVRDRRIRDEFLHVRLHHRDEADVDHRDQRQRDHDGREEVARVRRDRQREAQETVRAELQHDRGQHDRAARRRFDVRVRQPRVHRPHRHLHREREEERDEEQHLRRHRDLRVLPRREVERMRLRVQIDQRDQHQQRAGERVQEELERRVHAVRAAPHADDDVHRDQRRLEEHVEQQAVSRREHADHDPRQDQERGEILRHVLGDHLPAGDHDDYRDERGQHDEPHRDAVDAQVIRDVETLDPRRLLDELQRGGARIEAGDQRDRHGQARQRADQRDPARRARMLVGTDREHDEAENDRQPDRGTENRKRVH
ncbi:hypothetical protein BURPS1710b_1447 [Burkholderia pseudomallei 1710b]|uniref:Uncharacterized protein n=1 Tax=Burkholderia pseudomallei (strain 1710b) TaxID=320372 RepID=Q3JU97_BURP1|nr:hypothetical protein BURPS1710b_1447 [Burkholderia pseudomallei 1710b]